VLIDGCEGSENNLHIQDEYNLFSGTNILLFQKVYTFQKKGIYFFDEKYILFAQKVHTFFHRKYMPFIQRIYRFLKRYYGLMEKVLSFCPKSTIVLPKKYYRFL